MKVKAQKNPQIKAQHKKGKDIHFDFSQIKLFVKEDSTKVKIRDPLQKEIEKCKKESSKSGNMELKKDDYYILGSFK